MIYRGQKFLILMHFSIVFESTQSQRLESIFRKRALKIVFILLVVPVYSSVERQMTWVPMTTVILNSASLPRDKEVVHVTPGKLDYLMSMKVNRWARIWHVIWGQNFTSKFTLCMKSMKLSVAHHTFITINYSDFTPKTSLTIVFAYHYD